MYNDESEAEPPAEPGKPASVSILSESDALRPGAVTWLDAHVQRALRHLGQSGEVRIRIVGDDEMAAAHARYKGDPETTDVLTFDLADGASASGAPLDVDLIICADEASRRASELAHEPERELLLYVVHGLMHCLGHDDVDPGAAEAMHAAEDALLSAIGVGATYAPNAARAATTAIANGPATATGPAAAKEPAK
jgi:probable rRNA maturation factor